MSTTQQSTVRIGVFGTDPISYGCTNHHPGLWNVGYGGSLTHAEAVPVDLCSPTADRSWGDILEEIDGIVYSGFRGAVDRPIAYEEALCLWCKKNKMPLLAIDDGMLLMNTAFGGTLFEDLANELPEALQHRHPPEEGIRHAINVLPNTHLSSTYGEGEIIVNSEHRSGIQRVGRGFRISGQALDTVVEAIEWEGDDWFAMGVQWQPASPTASGLDIQLFRTFVEVCKTKTVPEIKPFRKPRRVASAA